MRAVRLAVWLVSVVVPGLLLAACSAVAPLRPEPVSTTLEPMPWPRNAPTIAVDDRRPDQQAHHTLVGAIEASIRQAMAPARPEPCPCFRLTVAVHEHGAVFRGGGSGFWRGHTSLTATLADASDHDLYRFRAEDYDE